MGIGLAFMVFAEFASASIWLRTNVSQIMVNKRLVPMQSVLLLLSPLTAYILSIFDMKCINRVLRYVIYFISRPTEIALLLGSPYLELSQGLSKQTAGHPRSATLPKATFTLHRYSFRPLNFCCGSSASTLYRIKTVPLPFPVYTVPDPFDFLLRVCAQQASHCMQGRKFALKRRQNICLSEKKAPTRIHSSYRITVYSM